MDDQLKEIVSEARRLRAQAEAAEAAFLIYLHTVEQNHMSVIQSCGMETFDRFLRSFELCRPERYRDFVAGMQKVGAIAAQRIGTEATMMARKLSGQQQAGEYVGALDKWREQHGEVFPTSETAERMLRNVDPRKTIPASVVRDEGRRALENDVARLKKENADLVAKLSRVEKERDALQKRCVQLSRELEQAKRRKGSEARP